MDSWDDYFLREKKLFHHDFSDEKITVSKDFLLPFKMVENLSETALVNLCLGSGILYHALELDDKIKFYPLPHVEVIHLILNHLIKAKRFSNM